jgi:cytochrome b involved in lipid metabolism
MAVAGGVYDLTPFVPQHPGGKIIAASCGMDGTTIFNAVPEHMKSSALAVMESTYRIGTLSIDTSAEVVAQ